MPTIVPFLLPTPFPEGNVNAYLLPEPPVTLVDTGTWQADSLQLLGRGLETTGIPWSDLEQVMVTHMHTDHSGGVEAIQQKVDVPVYVHRRASYAIEGGRREFERVEDFFVRWLQACGAGEMGARRERKYRDLGWRNVHYLDGGERLPAGGREWEVVYVPGHSQSDLLLWDPVSGDTLVGDHLLPDISANALVEPPAPSETERPKSLLKYRDSMRESKAHPFGRIYPGHGDPFVGHAALIERRFAEHARRCEDILGHLRAGRDTIAAISAAMFPRLRGNGVFLGLSEVFGHMDLLLADGRARIAADGDVGRARIAADGDVGRVAEHVGRASIAADGDVGRARIAEHAGRVAEHGGVLRFEPA